MLPLDLEEPQLWLLPQSPFQLVTPAGTFLSASTNHTQLSVWLLEAVPRRHLSTGNQLQEDRYTGRSPLVPRAANHWKGTLTSVYMEVRSYKNYNKEHHKHTPGPIQELFPSKSTLNYEGERVKSAMWRE